MAILSMPVFQNNNSVRIPKCISFEDKQTDWHSLVAEMVMRETLDGPQGGLQIGARIVTNLRYAYGIILLATPEAELQELG